MEKFEEKLTKLNEDETFQSAMTYEEDQKLILNTEKKLAFEEGISQGMTQGIIQGAKQEKVEIARSMLKDGVAVEIINQYTKLSLEEINNLKL